MDFESLLLSAPWLGVLIWVLLYLADYLLTIVGARLYSRGGGKHLVFDGSYELNPAFVADVNSLRLVSRRFVAALVVWSILIGALCYVGQMPEWRNLALVGLGAILFLELAMLPRHVGNIVTLRRMNADQGVEGSIKYARWLSLETAAVQLSGLAALILVAALAAWKALLFGAALGLAAQGFRFARLSRLERKAPGSTLRASSGSPDAVRERRALIRIIVVVILLWLALVAFQLAQQPVSVQPLPS